MKSFNNYDNFCSYSYSENHNEPFCVYSKRAVNLFL